MIARWDSTVSKEISYASDSQNSFSVRADIFIFSPTGLEAHHASLRAGTANFILGQIEASISCSEIIVINWGSHSGGYEEFYLPGYNAV
jgi:hypothetical protein